MAELLIYDTPNPDIKLYYPNGGTPYLKYFRFDVNMIHFDSLVYIGMKHTGSIDPNGYKHCFNAGLNKVIYFSEQDLAVVLKDFNEFKRNHL